MIHDFMSYLITLNIIIVVLSALTPFAIAQELEVFAVTREMIPDYPGSKKQKLKSEFDGIRVYLNDSTLDLTRVSTSFFNDFYIFNWRDDYNLLVERCIAKKKCDSIIVQHYEKSVKSKLLKKKSKSKYLKISEFDFGMNHSNCNDVYRFTIEKEEKNDIEYPDSTEHLDMLPQYDEKRTVVKRFYVYFCY